MDPCDISASTFHKLADRYRDKYMDLTMYDDSYREFCDLLRPGCARVLDAACGPGNVSRYLMAQRPDLDLLGIDLAPRMIELAREAVPLAHFAVHDCRHFAELRRCFDGIICAFGLPYLSLQEATSFIVAAGHALEPGGVLYLSTMLGNSEDSGLQHQVYVNYHSEDEVLRSLQNGGFTRIRRTHVPSPSTAVASTTDLIVIGQKPP